MRYDLNILWVEDTKKFFEFNSETLTIRADDLGIRIKIDYIQDAKELLDSIDRANEGFRLYDILFVDYSLSNGIVGDSVIRELRKRDLDADILFYSSQLEDEMRKKITDDFKSFQGVYIADRYDFLDTAYNLIQKNAKRLLSLKNIRGMLMDQTSENDYTIMSYIIRRFKDLSVEQKQEICKMVKGSIIKHLDETERTKKHLTKLENEGIENIKNVLKMPTYVVSIALKYKIFEKMIEFLNESSIFQTYTLDTYMNDTIKKRNMLAHRKLELTSDQKYILSYSNIEQYIAAKGNVTTASSDDRISFEEWKQIRKQVVGIGNCFDEIQDKLHSQG